MNLKPSIIGIKNPGQTKTKKPMKLHKFAPFHSRASIITAALGLSCVATPSALSQTTWNGGSVTNGQWNVGSWANFNGTNAATPSGQNIVFGSVNINGWTLTSPGGSRSIGSLTFESGSPAYDIRLKSAPTGGSTDRDLTFVSGNTGITIEAGDSSPHTIGEIGGSGGGSVILADSLGIAHNGSGTLTINRPIADGALTFGITKTGTGMVFLSGANTYSGSTQVDGGILTIGNLAAFGTTSGVTAGAAGTVGLGVGSAGTTTHYEFADVVALFSTNTLSGFSLDDDSGVAIDTTASSFVVLNQGGAGTGLTGTRSLIKLGTNTLQLNQTNTYTGATIIKEGGLTVGAGLNGGGLSPDSTITIESGASFGVSLLRAATQGTDFSSDPITGDGNFAQLGSGVTTFNAANSYTGSTTIAGGMLKHEGSATLTSGNLILSGGGVVGLTDDLTRARGTGDNEVQWTGSGGFAAVGADRTVTLSGGNVQWNSGSFVPAARELILGHPEATQTVTFTNNINFAGGSRTIQVNDGAANVDAIMGGSLGLVAATGGSLNKTGAGTLSLTKASFYTGTTSVNAGVLLLDDNSALPGGIAATGGTSALVLNGGVLGLGSGDFTRKEGGGSDEFEWANDGGFAAYGADRTVNVGTLSWGAIGSSNTLILGADGSDSTLIWTSTISFAGSSRTVQVNDGSAAIDARFSGQLTGGGSSGITKTGAGTLEFSSVSNAYAGATIVSAGTLSLGASNVLPDTTDVSIGAATLEVGAAVTETASTLDCIAAAMINLGTGATLAFADSSAITWAGTLEITGDFVSGASLNFGNSSGLTTGQLASISAAGFSAFALDGSGFLTATAVSSGYSSWASLNGAGANFDDDHDDDGVSNGVEFFIGGPNGNTTGFTATPGVIDTAGTLSVTWTHAADYVGTYMSDFVVETSETLSGVWDVATTSGTPDFADTVYIDGDDVTYTFLSGTKKFARLRVTGP